MSTTESPRADLVAWIILLSLGLIWGGAFTATGAAVRDLPPFSVAAGRLAVGALLLLPLAFAIAGGLPKWRDKTGRKIWRAAAAAAFCANAAPFALLAWAQTHIPSGLAGVFMASLPLIVLPLAAWAVPGERLTATKLAGFVIGFIGVLFLLGADRLSGLGGGDALSLLAQLACIGAAAGYALGSIVTKLSPRTHPVSFAAATMLLAALMSAPAALLFEAPLAFETWSAKGALAVLFLGAVPTALAMVLLYAVVQRAGPSFLSLVNYQVPVWALVFGVIFLGETAPPRAPVALALILAGVAISQFGPALHKASADAPRA